LCSHLRTSLHFMKPKGLLPLSQEPFTCPYPEQDQSSQSHLISPRSILLLSTYPRLALPIGLFPSTFHTNSSHEFPFSPVHVTCLAHLILDFIILDLILATSSLFGPNSLLSTLFSSVFSLCSSLSVSDQVLHPYRNIGKLWSCIFRLLHF
jgi:hypothetical protein